MNMNVSLPQIECPVSQFYKLIIAVKGHPSTGKTKIARLIGEWARGHVLYIDDFLQALSLEQGYTAESTPSPVEADHLLGLALVALYEAAGRHLHESNRPVIIKSRLSSPFELDLLIRLMHQHKRFNFVPTIIIVESQMKNEYRWKSMFDGYRTKKWYKARGWDDIQKAKEEDDDSQAFDFHLLSLLEYDVEAYPNWVRRLVLDYFDDAFSTNEVFFPELTPDFKEALRYLLSRNYGECNRTIFDVAYKARYVAQLHFSELSRYLLEEEIRTSKERRKYVCSSSSSRAGSCVFKFWEELPSEDDSCYKVCKEGVASGKPGYRCHFCFVALHKSCAEKMPNFYFLHSVLTKTSFQAIFPFMVVCKSCNELGKCDPHRCESCLYENNLRRALLPTILNHDCHEPHFLSIQFAGNNASILRCKACGEDKVPDIALFYVCHFCKFVYHMKCAFLPRELKHEHGGHEHVMKLMYLHEGMDQEDDHWCNVCYEDMDPQLWFYFCLECPYYLIHARERCVGRDGIQECVINGNLPFRQIQAKVESDSYPYIFKDDKDEDDCGSDERDHSGKSSDQGYDGSGEMGDGGKGELDSDEYGSDEMGDLVKGRDDPHEEDYGLDEMLDDGNGSNEDYYGSNEKGGGKGEDEDYYDWDETCSNACCIC